MGSSTTNSLPSPSPALLASTLPPWSSDEAARQGQPDAEPALDATIGPVDLGEHVEHRRELALGNADAVVANGDPDAVVSSRDREPDVATVVRVLGRVGEKVREHLGQPHRVSRNRDGLGRKIDGQLVLGALDGGPAGLDSRADDEREVQGLSLHVDDAARDARHLEQIVHQSDQVAGLALHDGEHLPNHRILDLGDGEQLQSRDQGGQGIAQLVTEGGQEFVLAPVGDAKRVLGARALREVPADLVLAGAGAKGRSNRAQKRSHPQRALEQGHVAQGPDGFARAPRSPLPGGSARGREDPTRRAAARGPRAAPRCEGSTGPPPEPRSRPPPLRAPGRAPRTSRRSRPRCRRRTAAPAWWRRPGWSGPGGARGHPRVPSRRLTAASRPPASLRALRRSELP